MPGLEHSITNSDSRGGSQDFELFQGRWGFELEELKEFKGEIHIWQGTDDWLVPVGLQRLVAKQLPDVVQLHELEGEGHLSWFCFNEKNHRTVLNATFGTPKGGGGGMRENGVQGARIGGVGSRIIGKL